MSKDLGTISARGYLWSFMELFSVKGIQFLVMLIMARILTPEDYGVVGILLIFVNLADALIDGGFSQALIRKQNRTIIDESTIFFFNLVLSIFLFALICFLSPLIASFFDNDNLIIYSRVISLCIVIQAFKVVPRVICCANIDFKSLAKASIASVIISGIVGISLALWGGEVWALIIQQLVSVSVSTFVVLYYSRWKPVFAFSLASLRELFSFGSRILGSSIVTVIYNNLYPIVIGKFFSIETLGLYTRAKQFSNLPSINFTSTFQSVSFPVLCKIQEDDERLVSVYRKMVRVSSFIVFPIMIGLCACAKPFVLVSIGDKWIGCIFLLQLMCLGDMWIPLQAINFDLLQVKGKSKLFFRLEVCKKFLGLLFLLFFAQYGLKTLCVSCIFYSLLCLYINSYYTDKLLHLSLLSQIRDVAGILLLSFFMFLVMTIVINIFDNELLQLVFGVLSGIAFYIIASYFLKFEELNILINYIRRLK